MLAFIGLIGILLAVATQVGHSTVEFEILENQLELNEEQRISGQLSWGYRADPDSESEGWPFVCKIRNVEQRGLLKLTPGQKNDVNFRSNPIWPLKKQDPFKIYIAKVLKIPPHQIVGYVMTSENTEVVIDGSQN